MKSILIICLAFSAYSLQAQMYLGSASFICKDCNPQKQGRSYESMMGMVYNGSWPASGGDLVALHYFLPFRSGQLTSPVYEFGDRDLSINVYPNPTSDFLFISGNLDLQNPITIKLTNTIGQIAIQREWKPQGNLLRMEVSHLPSGFYALTLSESNYVASHIIQIIH